MRELPLGDLLELVIDRRGKTPPFVDGGVPVVSAMNIKNGRINWAERRRFVTPETFRSWMPVRTRKGDVLLTSEAPLGQVALVPTDDDLVVSQRLIALRGRPDVLDTTYLRYFLESSLGQERLRQRATGTTVVGIRHSELLKVLIPVPHLETQRRIADVLTQLDRLIDTDSQLMRQLAEATDTVWRQVTDTASEVKLFGDLATLSGKRRNPSEVDPATPYLGLEHFAEDGEGLLGVGEAGSSTSLKSVFAAGDILYGKLRPYFRKTARPNFGGVCSTEVWVLHPVGGVPAAFLEWIVARDDFTTFAMSGSGGTRMPRAAWEHVARMPVVVPAADVLAAASASTEVLREQYWALWDEIADVTRTRDELLDPLISGRVSAGEAA